MTCVRTCPGVDIVFMLQLVVMVLWFCTRNEAAWNDGINMAVVMMMSVMKIMI